MRALSQIKNKDYVRKYMLSGKKVMLIGASFDTATENSPTGKQNSFNNEKPRKARNFYRAAALTEGWHAV